jgi:ribonuclease D
MKTITKTDELIAFCEAAKAFDYVTIDTEFLRERTYYSKLCLIQLAVPGKGDDHAVLVDPLAHGLKLDALYALFEDETVVKVFHAARQDLEIFCVEAGVLPKPLFDTQVAAMVCGFGEQVGYETLVRKITKNSIDKSSRFTDWSRRPLTEAQKSYALADVTHLRQGLRVFARKNRKNRTWPMGRRRITNSDQSRNVSCAPLRGLAAGENPHQLTASDCRGASPCRFP